MKRRNFIKPASATMALPVTGIYSCIHNSTKDPKIRWAMGWIFWRDYKGTDISLTEALTDLYNIKADRIEFTPRTGELGQGNIDFPKIMHLLRNIDYKGWINVEQDFTAMTPKESATKNMKYINDVLKPIYS